MIQPYRIVQATKDDFQAIEEMHDACFDQFYEADSAGHHWWVALDADNYYAGFGGLKVSHKEGGAYLVRGGVLPAHRGQGLQRKLIAARVKWAREADLNYLVTDTIEGNYVSANNLIEAGFRMYDPITPWGADGNCYWRKELV